MFRPSPNGPAAPGDGCACGAGASGSLGGAGGGAGGAGGVLGNTFNGVGIAGGIILSVFNTREGTRQVEWWNCRGTITVLE